MNFFKNSNLSFLIGIILGIILLYLFLPIKSSNIDFDQLALGKENKTVWANYNDKTIHCNNLKSIDYCLKDYKAQNKELPVTIWFGNSQLHAINQYNLGDESAALHLHRNLIKHNIYTLTFSQANANLQEHYLYFTYLLNKFPIKTLILPIFFDDMREDQIRDNFINILNDPIFFEKNNKTLTGKNLISRLSNKDLAGNISEVEEKNLQSNFENFFDKKLSKIWKLWSKRGELRSNLYTKLYHLRNSVLGINASTTRRIIPGRYAKNLQAYRDILNLANENNIKVLVYIPPIRNDIKIPYDVEKYNKFKKTIKEIANEKKVWFFSLENLVPSEFWGRKPSTNLEEEYEVDFMHFKAEGHRLLADAIFFEINKLKLLINK